MLLNRLSKGLKMQRIEFPRTPQDGPCGDSNFKTEKNMIATQKTKVIFRKFKSENKSIIAIFPEFPGSLPSYYMNYQHIGQHGDGNDYLSNTLPATPEEYADLKKELENIGYNLEPRKKLTYKMVQARIAAINSK